MTAIERNTEKLVSDLKRIVHHGEDLLQATKDTAGDKVQDVRKRLTETLETAKDTCRRLEDKAVAGAKAADRTIREHPYPSLGVAFGVGLLIGVLVARK